MRVGLAITVALAGVAVACRAPTEVTIDLSTDIACSDLVGTNVTVGELIDIETKAPVASSTACNDAGTLGSLVIVPSHGIETVAIRVIAGLNRDPKTCVAPDYGLGCIVARRAIRYISHTPLRLAISLRADCNGITCSATETCTNGMCASATIPNPSACAGSGCNDGVLTPVDAGSPLDAGSDDAGAADAGALSLTTLAVGQDHSCALQAGSVMCWGSNSAGQLGDGTMVDHALPAPVQGLPDTPIEISAGSVHTCALTASGLVYCWGQGASGQLGNGGTAVSLTPTQMTITDVVEVKAHYFSTCVRTSDGIPRCTGFDGYGELGGGSMEPEYVPTPMIGVGEALEMAVGDEVICVRTANQSVDCSGSNIAGSLGTGMGPNQTTAVQSMVPPAFGIAATGGQVSLLTADGGVVTWGRSAINLTFRSPTVVPGLSPAAALGTAAPTCIRVAADGSIQCFNEATFAVTPVPNLVGVVEFAVGADGHACARTASTSPSVYCWGANNDGQLGDGTMDASTVPVAVHGF